MKSCWSGDKFTDDLFINAFIQACTMQNVSRMIQYRQVLHNIKKR